MPSTEAGKRLKASNFRHEMRCPVYGNPFVPDKCICELGPAIEAIEREAVEAALSEERIAEALVACGLIRRYQEYATRVPTMKPVPAPYLAREWAVALRAHLLPDEASQPDMPKETER